jgi:menaquinone-specific isochorismate synthase
VAAVGAADVREGGAEELREGLGSLLSSDDRQARYYGGLRFDAEREPDAEWAPFGAYRFVLPRFELHAGNGEAMLVCNLVLPRDAQRHAEILKGVGNLSFSQDTSEDGLPGPAWRLDLPDEQGWRENVERALAALSEGWLEKVVLARRTELGVAGEIDAALLAEMLREATPGCFHYYVEPKGGVAFLGASPSGSSAARGAPYAARQWPEPGPAALARRTTTSSATTCSAARKTRPSTTTCGPASARRSGRCATS